MRERLYGYVNLHGLPLKFQVSFVRRLFYSAFLLALAEFKVQTFSCLYSTGRFAAVCRILPYRQSLRLFVALPFPFLFSRIIAIGCGTMLFKIYTIFRSAISSNIIVQFLMICYPSNLESYFLTYFLRLFYSSFFLIHIKIFYILVCSVLLF